MPNARIAYRRMQKGAALVTVLTVVALVVVLVSTLVGAALQTFQIASEVENTQTRVNLAESAIAVAISDVLAHYGTSGWRPSVYQVPAPAGSGLVTFQNNAATPWSTDNLAGSVTTPGYNRVVPAATLHLIGMGSLKGQTSYVETMVSLPQYPYAIAAGGQILSSGNLLVAGVSNSGQLTNLSGTPTPACGGWLPAEVANNAGTLPYAVNLGCCGVVTITGDLRSVGAIAVLPAGSRVADIQPYCNPVPIPTIHAACFDPQQQGLPYAPISGTGTAPYTFTNPLSGWARSCGSLTVDGAVPLDNGALYVNGNLTVTGALTGVGAVFVAGTVQIGAGASLSSTNSNSLALVADDNVSLTSAPNCSSDTLEGIVYAGGSLQATNFSIIGSYVANQGNVTLQNASVIHANDKASFTMGSGSFSGGLLVALTGLNLLNLPGSISNVQVSANPLVANPATDNDFTWHLSYTQGGVPQTQSLSGSGLVAQLTAWNTDGLLASAEANLIVNGTPSGLLNAVLGLADVDELLGANWTAEAIQAAHQAGISGGASNSLSLTFNQFLDPTQQARIRLWHTIARPTP